MSLYPLSTVSTHTITMQRQRQKKTTVGASMRTRKPDRFTPLLVEIRSGLGDYWTFYEECIDGVLDAAARQQDATAWLEQMQQLVEGVDKVQFSHEGILFLLRDMGIRAPIRQSWGEGEGATLGMYLSPPLSPREEPSKTIPSSIDNMPFLPVRPPSTMSSLPPLRPLRPNMPAIAPWPRARAPTPRTQHEKRQQRPVILRDNVLPFDFSASVLPGLTFPKDFRAYHCPRDEIILTENYVPPLPNPLRKTSNNPVFFSNPALMANVAELFGYTGQSKDNGQHDGSTTWQAPPALPYDPHHDDLMVWKKRSKGSTNDERKEVKVNGADTDTWPPWNSRLDLEM